MCTVHTCRGAAPSLFIVTAMSIPLHWLILTGIVVTLSLLTTGKDSLMSALATPSITNGDTLGTSVIDVQWILMKKQQQEIIII